MSAIVENTRILAVDTSPAMLEVLKNFAAKQNYELAGHCDPAHACAVLNDRFQDFTQDYRCVILGWPQGDVSIIKGLLSMLETPDHQDLPLLIICQESDAEIEQLVKRRSKTHALLWKNYQGAANLIDRMPVVMAPVAKPKVDTEKPVEAAVKNINTSPTAAAVNKGKSALLVDTAPSICHSLRELMQRSGYSVDVANSADVARKRLSAQNFDVVVTDYHLHAGDDGEDLQSFCEAVKAANNPTVVAVVSGKYTDAIIKQSLTAGAAACLFKSESTELLYARIDALGRSLCIVAPGASTQTPVAKTPSVAVEKVNVEPSSPTPAVSSDKPPAVPVVAKKVLPPKAPPKAVVVGPVSEKRFATALGQAIAEVNENPQTSIRYSVLMLDVQLVAATGDRLSIGDSEPMRKIVEQSISRLYQREDSLAYLGDGRFVLLLANRKLQDALMLTRKVLQVVPGMIRYLNNMSLVSHSAVVQLQPDSSDASTVLQQCRAACLKTRADSRDNCALVMPMRKYLTALESEAAA